MSLDHAKLDQLLQNHPAWRLLRSDHVALVASFLHRVYITPNVRTIAQADLCEALEDDLYLLREQLGEQAFPRTALEYLNDWAGVDKGWLRKFYRAGSDAPVFDMTPASEKAIAWLGTLTERSFVGTESRLLTLFELLRQISTGTQTDVNLRLQDLQRQRDAIDAEMSRVLSGNLPVLGDTAVKERFAQFTQLSRELLADFREVEQNFRLLDRTVRERITLWRGSRGALLEDILGERDAIADSDQGRSFRAFWDFLMSSQRQQELSAMLEQVLQLEAVAAMQPDMRVRRVHHDWMEAGEHTQRTVALLSQQLRRFLDDQSWLENRRIMDLMRNIEGHALRLRDAPPQGPAMHLDTPGIDIALPFERPLHAPGVKTLIASVALQAGEADMDDAALYSQIVIDKAKLAQQIRRALQRQGQITLGDLCQAHPLQHGLAELIAYLQLASSSFASAVDETSTETITWSAAPGPASGDPPRLKRARLPRVIFVR